MGLIPRRLVIISTFQDHLLGALGQNGAIEFIAPGGPGHATPGEMDAVVLTDGTTITINGSNQLTVIGGVFSEKFTVDAHTAPGTNPVVPDGTGNITVTGGQVAAGTTPHVIRTDSLAANTYTIEVQRSQAVASSTVGDNGVCHFDSADFDVDANGFVTFTGTVPLTITGDIGGPLPPTAGNWDIITNQASNLGGATLLFTGSGSILRLQTTDSNKNTLFGQDAGSLAISGIFNSGFGQLSLNQLSSGNANSAFGLGSLQALTTGINNTAMGYQSSNVGTGIQYCSSFGFESLISETTGTNATAIGAFAGQELIGTANNVCIGYSSLATATTGSYNTCLGAFAGNGYTSSESSNIIIGNLGTVADSNTTRIGTQGAGNGQVNKCFVAGIVGVTVANTQLVTINSATGQLGVMSASPLPDLFAYTAVNHAASPYTVLSSDEYLGVTTTGGVVTLKFPNAPLTGQSWIVKDTSGTSATSAITITTVGGAVTIDGATSQIISTNYEAVNLIFNGASYEVF